MKVFSRLLTALVLVFSLASATSADCPKSLCSPLECVNTGGACCGCRWFQHDEDPAYWGLYQNGVQIAGYDADFDEFREYDRATDSWKPATAPPWGKRVAPPTGRVKNFGNNYKAPIEQQQEPNAKPKYRINGKPATRSEVIDMIQAAGAGAVTAAHPRLPDDKNKLRVTAIGIGRESVDRDMATSPALAKAKGSVVYKSYDAAKDWEAAGFAATGSPTVTISDPKTGQELHRQNDYNGPEPLARAIEAVEAKRAADPTFDPSKTPDQRTPSPIDLFGNQDANDATMAAGIFAAIAVALRKIL